MAGYFSDLGYSRYEWFSLFSFLPGNCGGQAKNGIYVIFFFPLLFLEGTKIVPTGLARYVFDNMLHIKTL